MKIILSRFFAVYWLTLLICCDKKAENIETSNSSVVAVEVAEHNDEIDVAVAKNNSVDLKPQAIESKIIKKANLRYESNDLQQTYNQIFAAVQSQKAVIQSDVEGKNYESLFRTIIVRVPNQNFDSFLHKISKGVSYFERKEISSTDVTEEYIDIDARLKAKKILELRYLELLKKANKVSEMLEIETQLSNVREEIEAKEGQLKYIQNRVAFSTITIEFYKQTAEEAGVTVSYGSKIWNAIKSGFNGLSSFFIGMLQLWPFIIILVLLIYFIRKRFKKKTI